MDILNPADLKSLIAHQGKWSVSLYLPTHRVGNEQQQDPIRLKNLLAEAETKLLANGLRRPEVQKLMRPAEELLWNADFWQHQSDGLAIFLSDGFHVIYRLPVKFEELLFVSSNFHIKPLVPVLGRGIKFYVLAVSQNKIRLFQANADTMSEVDLNFPTSMSEVLRIDEAEQFVNMHTIGGGTRSEGQGGGAFYHGHNEEDEVKTRMLRFLQSVNDGLNALLEDKNIPMVLAGVEYLLSMYREATTYQNVLKDAVLGNPDRENLKELHQQAWQIVRPIYEESQKKAFEKYEQFHGQQNGLAISDLATAVKAAKFGQIETLFVPLGVQNWGRYDAENDKVILETEPGPGSEDLFDLAVAETILNSGQVFAVPREQMPGDGELAAILRYDVPIL
jgi:hypothetical protein